MNEAGQTLEAVTVKITNPDGFEFVEDNGDRHGVWRAKQDSEDSKRVPPARVDDELARRQYRLRFSPLRRLPSVKNIEENLSPPSRLTLSTWLGLDPLKASADGTKLDVTSSSSEFDQQPQPGSTFYIKQDEVFGKPG